ncbi:MAG: hypothetical protein Q7R67_02745 [bacterium]|nr:hypothetical protein [bacterium]
MKKDPNFVPLNELPLTISEFLKSYNENMPMEHPQVSLAQLHKFKEAHQSMFKTDGIWSLDQHRKRLIEWLPQNI